jgi:hypothetical protein
MPRNDQIASSSNPYCLRPTVVAQENELTLTPAEKQACIEAGGQVIQSGVRNEELCVTSFKDAGKVCSGDADCDGQCVCQGPKSTGDTVTGTCQATDLPFGCRTFIEDGKLTDRLCLD